LGFLATGADHAGAGHGRRATRAHYHLEFDLLDRTSDELIRVTVARLREPSVTAGGFNLVLAFGPRLWGRLLPETQLDDFRAFEPIAGLDQHHVPATQHDLWIWIHGTGPDVLLDAARTVTGIMSAVARLAAEQPGFVYRDSRDLTGFIDGTANPPVHEAPAVALVPEAQPGAGGSYAIAMRWVHDLHAFEQLAVADQEAVFARTKPDSVEFDDAAKPPNAHVARVGFEEDGQELELFRRSVPYGTIAEQGLFFVAFSADPSRFDKMLARMFGTADGIRDRLTDFSRPVSASYYFAPSLDVLAAVCA
jgi:putative iron-dependent peroxidase